MAKKMFFLSIFNFVSLCASFLILPFNYRAFDYWSSAEAKLLIASGSIEEGLYKAEQIGFKSGVNGYNGIIIFVFVVLAINGVASFLLSKEMKKH